MRRVAILAVLAFGAATSHAGDDVPLPHLVPGQIATLFPAPATRAASALIDVPPGIHMLHVFVSRYEAYGLTVEEGPVGESGEFLEFIRHEKQSGPLHLVRMEPAPGLHRVVVIGSANARGGAAVDVEFDHDSSPPIVDLGREGLPGFVRRFRLYVPPHEGIAELRGSRSADGIRVRLRGPRGDVGEDVDLPVALPGTENGGMYEVEILRGTPEALARMDLYLSRSAGSPPAPPLKPVRLFPGAPVTVFLGGHGSDRADFVLGTSVGDAGYSIVAKATSFGEDQHPDPDLFIERGRPVDSPEDDADYLGIGRGASESIHLGGTLGLPPDEYYVRVQLVDGEQPADVTILVTRISESLQFAPAPTDLPLDAWVKGSIHAETATIQWFSV